MKTERFALVMEDERLVGFDSVMFNLSEALFDRWGRNSLAVRV